MFSYFKHCCILFNVNEHLAVPFVELVKSGSYVAHLHFFCLHWITCVSILTVTQNGSDGSVLYEKSFS